MENQMNIKGLRDDLLQVYNDLRNKKEVDPSELNRVKTTVNIAGKIMSSAKLQMDYNKSVGRTDARVEFLESQE